MKYIRFILFPFAIVYGLITLLRNGFYRIGIFKSSKFSLPIINVGNLSMGGTGKTPHTEYLIRLLKGNHKLATLSRGFGRKERGFILAESGATARQIGDEPLQYFNKFGEEINVAVDANRVTGVMDLCRLKPETDVILLDDAYQHRAIHAGLNILITAYQSPFYTDFILPVGNLRELRLGKKRADIIVVSKCPDFDTIDQDKIRKRIAPLPHQSVFFSRIRYGNVYPLKRADQPVDNLPQNIILVTGIAKSGPLVNYLAEKHAILHHFKFNDHHNFRPSDLDEIHNIFDKFTAEKPVIITTEKDAMRLLDDSFADQLENHPWFYQSIEIEVDDRENFDQKITQYVEKNS